MGRIPACRGSWQIYLLFLQEVTGGWHKSHHQPHQEGALRHWKIRNYRLDIQNELFSYRNRTYTMLFGYLLDCCRTTGIFEQGKGSRPRFCQRISTVLYWLLLVCLGSHLLQPKARYETHGAQARQVCAVA